VSSHRLRDENIFFKFADNRVKSFNASTINVNPIDFLTNNIKNIKFLCFSFGSEWNVNPYLSEIFSTPINEGQNVLGPLHRRFAASRESHQQNLRLPRIELLQD